MRVIGRLLLLLGFLLAGLAIGMLVTCAALVAIVFAIDSTV